MSKSTETVTTEEFEYGDDGKEVRVSKTVTTRVVVDESHEHGPWTSRYA